MGLDITAYKNVKFIETLPDVEEFEKKYDWQDKFDFTYDNPSFPDRQGPIKPNAVYSYEDEFGFRAGSYGGYNEWREQLSQVALNVSPHVVWNNPAKFAGMPFVELINFSDCEGILGTEVCQKLLKDFGTFQAQADQQHDEWFTRKYNEWHKAFEYAAQNGYIDFH